MQPDGAAGMAEGLPELTRGETRAESHPVEQDLGLAASDSPLEEHSLGGSAGWPVHWAEEHALHSS